MDHAGDFPRIDLFQQCYYKIAKVHTDYFSYFILGIKDKISNQEEFLKQTLKGACSAPANLLEGVSGYAC